MSLIAALTAAFNANEETGPFFTNLPVAENVNTYVGSILAIDAAGNANPASDTAGLHVLGRCDGLSYTQNDNLVGSDGINNPGAAGAIVVNAKAGIFRWQNSTTNPITKAMIGKPAFVEADSAVASSTTHLIVAGIIVDVDSQGVWVDTRRPGALVAVYAPTQNSITDSSGGTAAAPVAGVRTIAALVGVDGTASDAAPLAGTQNAISDLAAELNLVKADLAALIARLG